MVSQDHKPQTKSRSTATAIVIGILYPLAVTLVLALMSGRESPLLPVTLIAGYGISGAVLGYMWPDRGWQLGLYLVAFWILLFFIALVFSDLVPWNGKLFLKDLAWHMSIIVAAFIGIALGKVIEGRRVAVIR